MPILCGTDFSPHAADAATVAAAIGIKQSQPVRLAHTLDIINARDVLEEETWRLEPLEALLQEESARLRRMGAEVETVILAGPPEEALVKEANERNASLLILGSLGRGASSWWRMGGASERTAQHARVPVLVVRSAEPFLSWLRGEKPLRVMVGLSAGATLDIVTRWVGELRSLGPCDVSLVHIYDPVAELERLGQKEAPGAITGYADLEKILVEELRARIGSLPGEGTVQLRALPSQSHIGIDLAQLAEWEHADLLVVGSHQRRGLKRLWHGSVSLEVLERASTSVACLPLSLAQKLPPQIPVKVEKILVPTDLSPLSNLAVPFACLLPKERGTITLLHVTEAPPQEEEKKKLQEQLSALLPPTEPNIKTHLEIVTSENPAEAICHAAERLGADLICMASHGRSGFSRGLIGPVAQAVMNKSRRPTLIVKPPQDD